MRSVSPNSCKHYTLIYLAKNAGVRCVACSTVWDRVKFGPNGSTLRKKYYTEKVKVKL